MRPAGRRGPDRRRAPQRARADLLLQWPAGALYPGKAAASVAARVAQLRAVAPDCATMCPICLVNLRKAANGTLRVRDISEYLREGAA